jgi:hypothetical protein
MLLVVANTVSREKLATIVCTTDKTVPLFAPAWAERKKWAFEYHFDTAIKAFVSTG